MNGTLGLLGVYTLPLPLPPDVLSPVENSRLLLVVARVVVVVVVVVVGCRVSGRLRGREVQTPRTRTPRPPTTAVDDDDEPTRTLRLCLEGSVNVDIRWVEVEVEVSKDRASCS